MGSDVFLYGTLCHGPLLAVVLGYAAEGQPADLPGHRAVSSAGASHAVALPDPQATFPGILVTGLGPDARARLSFYAACLDLHPQSVLVQRASGVGPVDTYLPARSAPADAAPWSLSDWQARLATTCVATAQDVMALYGRVPAERVAARYGMMLVRGASRARAAIAPAPTDVRFHAGAGDVVVDHVDLPYARFFAIEEYELRHRRFAGGQSPQINRAVFVSGDAVTVLPYDPVRDCVLLVEQFRAGPFARGDTQPWLLEAIAGRVDPGETPEEAGRREAEEEAGLTLGALLPVAGYYPTPGAKTEFLYSYVALADLPPSVTGVFGVADEAEDIRTHLVGFDRLMQMVTSGEVANAPLLISVLWLQRERARLRAGPGA